jgi:hypothetical protein
MTGHNRDRVMSNEINSEIDPSQPLVYQIRIKGHLGRQWTDWFEGLTIQLQDNGETLLTGPVVDQAALHGLLKKVRDVAMPLVSVIRVKPEQADASPTGCATRFNKQAEKKADLDADDIILCHTEKVLRSCLPH